MKDNKTGLDASITCFVNKDTDKAVCFKGDEVEEIALPSMTISPTMNGENFASYLFQTLGAMDIVISNIALRGMGNSIKILFNIKDGAKSTALNMSDERLNTIENIVLGIGAITASIIVGVIVGEGILAISISILIGILLNVFLVKFYLYLKDNALGLWENIKAGLDSTAVNITLLKGLFHEML